MSPIITGNTAFFNEEILSNTCGKKRALLSSLFYRGNLYQMFVYEQFME